VLNSLQVALGCDGDRANIRIPAALALDRADFPGKALFRRLVLLPLTCPASSPASHLHVVQREGAKLSLMTIVLGHGTALISLVTHRMFSPACKNSTGAQEEASTRPRRHYEAITFWRVTVPQPELPFIGAALLHLHSLDGRDRRQFLPDRRDNTLPLEILGRLRRGHHPRDQRRLTIIFVSRW